MTGFDFVNFQGSTLREASEIREIVESGPDLVFVTNPNNPVGEYCPAHLLRALVETCGKSGIVVLIDEMQNFLPTAGKGLSYGTWIQSENVVRVDSFSKRFGLAEYRSGWVIGPKTLIGDRFHGVVGRTRGLMGNAPRAANDATMELLNIEINRLEGRVDALAALHQTLMRKGAFVHRRLQANPRVNVLGRDACFNLTIQVKGASRDIHLADRLMQAGTMC